METMIISNFKSQAIATLKRVKATGTPLRVTLRGVPVADVYPPYIKETSKVAIGSGKELTMHRLSDTDLVGRDFSNEWETL